MKKNIYPYILILSVALLIVTNLYLLNRKDLKKICVVNNSRLLENFEYQKKLNAEYLNIEQRYKAKLFDLNNSKVKLGNYSDAQIIDHKIQRLQIEVDSIRMKYNRMVFNQINSYIKKFSEDNHYDLILGFSGDGSILYSRDEYDKTDELIEYCNKSFVNNHE